MGPSGIEELENLIRESMKFTEVSPHLGSTETISLAEYRTNLQKIRATYAPQLRSAVSTCSLNVNQPDLWERLVGFVRNELAEYVLQDKFESAAAVLPGSRPNSAPVDVIVRNLLRRAILDGEQAAARAFFESVSEPSCSIADYRALAGVQVDEEVEVFDGIWLVPLPDSPDELPPYLPEDLFSVFGRRPGQVVDGRPWPRTLLRIEYSVSPIFHKPADTHTFDSAPDSHFIVAMKSKEVRDFDLAWFLHALSLSCGDPVRVAARWAAFLEPFEIFDLASLIGPTSTAWWVQGDYQTGSSRLSKSAVEDLKKLYLNILRLDSNTKTNLQVPITRWAKSLGLGDATDQMIDLGIAFEALYLGNSRDELSFRFALRASWYLGQNGADRQRLFPIFRNIYSNRSTAVHAGNFMERASDDDKWKFIEQAQSLCRKSIVKIIKAGKLPDWDALVLGGP